MQRRTRVRAALAATAVTALVVATIAAAPGASAAPTGRKMLANSAPKWLAKARHNGKANATGAVSLRLYLAPQGGIDALKAAAVAVSTPGSVSYRRFITPAQYHAQYDPTAATVASVSGWLASTGLRVTGVEANSRYISVSGTVAAAQAAFGVSLESYTHDGQTVQAPSGNASVPTSVSGAIQSVSGLDTTQNVMTHSAPPPPAFVNARPCSIYYGQLKATVQADLTTPLPKFRGKTLPYAPCGYTGSQYRAAYESNSTLDGSGITVGITDAYASPTIVNDINTYTANHGDGSWAPGQYTQTKPSNFTNQKQCDPSGWYGEQTLDIEAVHAMAPGANVHYYASRSCLDADFADLLAQVVDRNEVQLVTNSWGEPEEDETTEDAMALQQSFLQGAMQGISFLFSSGDNGDELANTGIKQADSPASSPYVTAVGGTSDAIGADGSFLFQTGWGTNRYLLSADGKSWVFNTFLYGAGGGFSSIFNRPAYQNGVVPNNAPPGRAVPDVGLDGDPNTGMLIGITQTFPDGSVKYGEYRIGGTSLSSPLFAGMTALTLQNSGGGGAGLLNPIIYGQSGAGTFTDVKGNPKDAGVVRVDYVNGVDPSDGLLYSVRTFNEDSSLSIAKGWDDVTGIGSPNPGWLKVPIPPPAG
jgi:subtilase family serine protease